MLGQILMVIALCWGTVTSAPGPREDSLNNYLDLVFDNLQVLILENGFDPAVLPDAVANFSDKVLGVTWHGEAKLYDGYLRGISSLHRSDDANFIRDEENIVIGLSAGLGLGTMEGHYKCLATFMDLGPHADVTMNINGASVTFGAVLDRSVCRFHVSQLNVEKIGHISVDIHGLGLLNWIFEIVAGLVVNVVEVFIRGTIENSLSSFVNEALDSVDLGILGPILGCEPSHI